MTTAAPTQHDQVRPHEERLEADAREHLRRSSPEGMPVPKRERRRAGRLVFGAGLFGLAALTTVGAMVGGSPGAGVAAPLGVAVVGLGSLPAWLAGMHRRKEHAEAERRAEKAGSSAA